MEQIIKMLEDHGIRTTVSTGRVWAKEWFIDSHILAEPRADFEWVDITDWTVKDASEWLGY